MRKLLYFFVISLAVVTANVQAALPTDPTQEVIYQASFGRADDMRLLLKQGEKADTLNADGVPVACLVAGRRDAEALNVMRVLKEFSGNLDIPDKLGQTPLFYAARKGNVEMTRLLLILGAKYDVIDKNGDTARNVAFGRGYNEIVSEIDQFIIKRNEEIMAQYQEYYNKVVESHKLVSEQQKKELEIVEKQKGMLQEKRKLEEEKYRLSEEEQKRLTAELAAEVAANAATEAAKVAAANAEAQKTTTEAQKKAQETKLKEQTEKEKELAAKRSPERLRNLVYDLSFNFCARQYWHYCRNVDLETEMSPREIADAINLHQTKLLELSNTITADFEVDGEYIKKISAPSEDWVIEQLDGMYSNRNRKEKGVGTLADAKKRCDKIASSFLLQPPKK